MLKIDKKLTIFIDGDDVDTLLNICEITSHTIPICGDPDRIFGSGIGQWTREECGYMRRFIIKMLDVI